MKELQTKPAFEHNFTCANKQVLHKIGAERACAAVVALDAPGANYRCVWALSKYYPNVKTFVRAHDVVHGLNLEKAGATAVMFTNPSTFHEIRHVLSWSYTKISQSQKTTCRLYRRLWSQVYSWQPLFLLR